MCIGRVAAKKVSSKARSTYLKFDPLLSQSDRPTLKLDPNRMLAMFLDYTYTRTHRCTIRLCTREEERRGPRRTGRLNELMEQAALARPCFADDDHLAEEI